MPKIIRNIKIYRVWAKKFRGQSLKYKNIQDRLNVFLSFKYQYILGGVVTILYKHTNKQKSENKSKSSSDLHQESYDKLSGPTEDPITSVTKAGRVDQHLFN